jgi:3-isopropylmalate/(R)-2-methylmalate dehydratase small subunit
LIFPQAGEITAGDQLAIDPLAGRIENQSQHQTYTVAGLPEHLMAMVAAGGLMPYLKQRLAGR